ncbi:MAG: hypothetical protein ACE10I_09905, partial [Candidatus Acidiferrales bacterium]
MVHGEILVCRLALLPSHVSKVDRPENLSTVLVDKILTKIKNCGAKAAAFPNITYRAEGVIRSFPNPRFYRSRREATGGGTELFLAQKKAPSRGPQRT